MDFLKVPIIDHSWVLNTPERNGILNKGPPKYANCNILGKGAYGTVFKATFHDRPVAVKVVKNRAGVNRTENEIHILGWKHRHIVRILKVESTINFGIIIMEHFPGQSLQLILDSMELPLVHRAFISLDILCALCYCHKQNLLHLDVKPQNILIAFGKTTFQAKTGRNTSKMDPRRSYLCKLCDFGSSMKLNEQKQRKISAGGTVRYMSPEALRSDLLSSASDIYSLGITMWQLKHRRVPYEAIQCNEVVAFQVVKNDLRPDSDLSRFIQANSAKISPQDKQKICRCEYYTTELSCPAKKKLQFAAFDKKKLSPRGCFSAGKKDFYLNSSISPRTPKLLHSNAARSAVRNLRKELDFIDCKAKSNDISLNLHIIFRDVANWETIILQQKENAFNSIIQNCWHSLPEKRLCTTDLYKQLKALLK